MDFEQWYRNTTELTLNLWEITQYNLIVVLICVQPVFVLVKVFDEQIRHQRREVVVSGNGNCFYLAVALRWNETRHEKHEEISRSSSRLFQKNSKSVISSGGLTDWKNWIKYHWITGSRITGSRIKDHQTKDQGSVQNESNELNKLIGMVDCSSTWRSQDLSLLTDRCFSSPSSAGLSRLCS